MTAPAPKPLPRLREDLVLAPADSGSSDAAWRIYDPLRHRYVAIDQRTAVLMAHWPAATSIETLLQLSKTKLVEPASPADVEALVEFLFKQGMTQIALDADWRTGLVPPVSKGESLLMRAVHSYLFFKVPLLAPAAFLESLRGPVSTLFGRDTAIGIALIGMLGLYLVSREWGAFIDQGRSLMSAAGLVQFGVTLFVVKIFHEFAHAFAAARYGCRVPVIGVAFMMGAPMLYADVSDTWRLSDPRKRLWVDAAGVIAELYIACIATLLWVFLPEGMPRQVAFLLATTSWIMSIAINLNPLMRFDGYFILSDLTGYDNLQARAFDVAVWRLREVLFSLGIAPPESLPERSLWFLTVYGWAIWIYRLVLFTGIALAVYAFFFKVLGIALFLFEIGYFIAKPVWQELRAWVALRAEIARTARTLWTLGILTSTILLFVVPWSTHVAVPAVLDARETPSLHLTRSARLVRVDIHAGDKVAKGDIVAAFEAPDLDNEITTTKARLRSVQVRLSRAAADREDLQERLVLSTTHASLTTKLAGLVREQEQLSVRAPIDGVVVDLNPRLAIGRWVGVKEPIVTLRSSSGAVVRGFASEADAWRITPGAGARFIAEAGGAEKLVLTVQSVAPTAALFIDAPELVATNGGAIDAPSDERRRPRPAGAFFAVVAMPLSTTPVVTTRLRGTLHVDGHAESFATATFRRVLRIMVREAGP